ncbi:hypothetical protein QM012_008144 [Aureobasidium pullulans]|uniref:Uncharacterized protein n=1 Tax=Aureobasidium pullulans TaxID=5580 RepID=A0ABR0TN55_AURPU
MGPEPQTKTEATTVISTLRSNFQSSAEAIARLEKYIDHLEELLLEKLGRQEFERRLEGLVFRDQRREESLFIPDDTSMVSRKRGSSSIDSGSSPKKFRSESLTSSSLSNTSGLGRSILDNRRSLHGNSPDVSPKTSRKTSILQLSTVETEQAISTEQRQMVQHPVLPRPPPPPPRRVSHSAMLPNIHPSSNFHSRSGRSRSSTPTAPPYSATHTSSSVSSSSPLSSSARRDSVHSDKPSKQSRSSSISSSSTPKTPSLTRINLTNPVSTSKRHIVPPRLPKNSVVPVAQTSTPLTNKPSSHGDKTSTLSSSSEHLAPSVSASRPFALPNKPGFGSDRAVLLLDHQQQQPLSLTRKPWRASKK